MRLSLSAILSASLLCIKSLVAAQSTREQFAALAAAHGGVIKLNSKTFDAITASDRDWSATVVLTAIAGHKVVCEPCVQFKPNYEAVANAWKKVPKDKRDQHFFAVLDFNDGVDIFRRLGLNSAPFVHFYPATKGPLVEVHPNTKQWTYDFSMHSFDADTFAEQLSPHTPVAIPYSKPLNYRLIFTVVGTLCSIFLAWSVFGGPIVALITSRWIWGIASLAFIVTMLGGFMFVRIRTSPYAGQVRGANGQPGISYIAAGYQNQYGAETQLIAGLYSFLAMSQVALMIFAPRLPSAARQKAAVFIWLAVSWTLFSVLVAIFRVKYPGYPFKLLL